MSTGQHSRTGSNSSISHGSRAGERLKPPAHAVPTGKQPRGFEPCAASASFFLYAQGNVVSCLHHDTLAIERKFDAHREDVLLIAVDNVSDIGAGRVVVSYDAGSTAIVWDLFTGDELARFVSYDHIRVAKFQRDGIVAFGDSGGNVTLFEYQNSEHMFTRTIYDPITALAPAADCKTFAIGYQNGSILIGTVQPGFSIIHTLNTQRPPSPICELAWHASSSKQKTEMLATQTVDGDLRVWSVAKMPHSETPRIIRQLGNADNVSQGPSWFAWSKSGRIIQHSDGETRSWDVRTKQVSHEKVPTVDNITAIANYGPNATLFTLAGNFTVQQYDLNPNTLPLMVANAQHVPTNAPPTPPDSAEPRQAPASPTQLKVGSSRDSALPIELDMQSTDDDAPAMSPLEKISREMDQLEDERRDCLGPLSPVSSHTSLSSASSYGRQRRVTASSGHRQRSYSSKTSESTGYAGTIFSDGSSIRTGSARLSTSLSSSLPSASSTGSFRNKGSLLPPSPREPDNLKTLDLFPFIKARLAEVQFRPPQIPAGTVTTDNLRIEMLSCVFGWDDDIESLIRDEQSRHPPQSPAAVLLSKWLGDLGPDNLVQLVGTKSMTSSDWMLLALSGMGADSQKKVAEAFVKRLLETGEVHPAVAIFLGLGELNDAVEVYVSRKYYLEAVLLTCLIFPTDWQRISYLVRQWGETVVQQEPHLSVRCFSCTSMMPSEPWFSPRAQDAMYAASMQSMNVDALSPMFSSNSAALAHRRSVKTAGLKLNTDFAPTTNSKAPNTGTPIADTAASPAAERRWQKSSSRGNSAIPDSAATATPGSYNRRRLNSVGKTPQTALAEFSTGQRELTRKQTPDTRSEASSYISKLDKMPSPAQAVFTQLREQSRSRNDSRDRNARGLQLEVIETAEDPHAISPHPLSAASRTRRYAESISTIARSADEISPLPTGSSMKSSKGRSIDQYISSLEEANYHVRSRSLSNRQRSDSRDGRSSRGTRTPSMDGRGRSGTRYIKPAKRSPSSPVALSSVDARPPQESFDDERYYGVSSPLSATEPMSAGGRSRVGRSATQTDKSLSRTQSPDARAGQRSESKSKSRNASRGNSRHRYPEDLANKGDRGRSKQRGSSGRRSSSSPSPPDTEALRAKNRQSSRSRRPSDGGLTERTRERSTSRQRLHQREMSTDWISDGLVSQSVTEEPEYEQLTTPSSRPLTRKELAAKELEDRRLSLARRPSAPPIPLPGEISGGKTSATMTDTGNSIHETLRRSHTVDPAAMTRPGPKVMGTSTSSTPIGLPATPRAMRHPRYISSDPDPQDNVPAVPTLPTNAEMLPPISYQPNQAAADVLGPLLPATTFTRPSGPQRSSSAPPVQSPPMTQTAKFEGGHGLGHTRKASDRDGAADSPVLRRNSPPFATVITEEAHEDEIIEVPQPSIIPQSSTEPPPPILPELQHLAGLTQAYPQPSSNHTSINSKSSALINIGIDGTPLSRTTTPATDCGFMVTSTSPSVERRANANTINSSTSPVPSLSPTNNNTGISSKWRNVAERMRSNSRNRNRQTPEPQGTPSPYETQLPSSVYSRTPELQRNATEAQNVPPPPPPVPTGGSVLEPTSATDVRSNTADIYYGLGLSNAGPPARPDIVRSNSAFQPVTYRNPKELRANMPPETLQPGVYNPNAATVASAANMVDHNMV